MTFVYMALACANKEEAQKITDALLEKRLIACGKILSPVESTYRWKGKIEKTSEILLLIETHESRCPAIEEVVRSLHSYDTFVLTATPMAYVSKGARLWLQESLGMIST